MYGEKRFQADAIYVRVLVHNVGTATAGNVEVYAESLRKRCKDGWETLKTFAPMNFRWSDIGQLYFPRIAPGMSKYCDVGEIMNPKEIEWMAGLRPGFDPKKTALKLLTIVDPNHRGNLVAPGAYALDLIVAAENAEPLYRTLEFELSGEWYADPVTMLREGLKNLAMRYPDSFTRH